MRRKAAVGLLAILILHACASSSKPAPPKPDQTLRGVASWYGEEYAGRTTANGEIFDPMQLTAAHRTLPFGTVVDVKNVKSGQTVRVRINDRGPFVGNRMIDLSYAAAQQIGLIDPGSGDVEVTVVTVGRGDREPPAPYSVTIADPKEKVKVTPAGEPPPIEFPLPSQVASKPAPPAAAPGTTTSAPAAAQTDTDAGFKVDVVEEHGGVETRKQVAKDGKTFETVPVDGSKPVETKRDAPAAPGHGAAATYDKTQRTAASAEKAKSGKFVVQVGAFSVEANATALQERLTKLGQKSFVVHDTLYRVRIGPFATRDDAVKARTALESDGISAIVMSE